MVKELNSCGFEKRKPHSSFVKEIFTGDSLWYKHIKDNMIMIADPMVISNCNSVSETSIKDCYVKFTCVENSEKIRKKLNILE